MPGIPRKAEGLSEQSVGHELMLADSHGGQVHVLNPTAATVWRAMDGKQTVADLESALRNSMAVPAGTDLTRIVQKTLGLLESKGLIRYN